MASGRPQSKAKDADRQRDTKSTATQLVDSALGLYRFGRTVEGRSFAVPRRGPSIARVLRGARDSLRGELARKFFDQTGRAANAGALTDALNVLEGVALQADAEPVYLRVAPTEGGVILDLGDPTGRVVRVDPCGWEVLAQGPVLFERTQLTGRHPEPVEGGNLDELGDFLNVTPAMLRLVQGWLAMALIPDIAHPLALLRGEQGTGKTTAARILARLIDPGPADTMSPPRDELQWSVTAGATWLVTLDNVSRVPQWFSDALCRAATGDAMVARRLYTNSEVSVLQFRRVIILTSIGLEAIRGDLADRSVFFDLEPIPKGRRLGDQELWRRYDEALPRLFGALLTRLSEMLAILPDVSITDPTRMADFDRGLAAFDRVSASSGARDTYVSQRIALADEVLDSDVLASAILELVDNNNGHWTGSPTELLGALPAARNRDRREWPNTAQALGSRLDRVAPALRERGVRITRTRAANASRRRIITLRSTRTDEDEPVQLVQPPSELEDGMDGVDDLGGDRSPSRTGNGPKVPQEAEDCREDTAGARLRVDS